MKSIQGSPNSGRVANLVLKLAVVMTLGLFATPGARADDETMSLMSPSAPNLGWSFDNGQEFKGATGSLAIDPTQKRETTDSLKLTGDFTNGGSYVSANRSIPNVDIKELTIWMQSPGEGQFTLRLVDGSGECHQLKVMVPLGSSWSKVVVPVERFFEGKSGKEPQSVANVTHYETWGGPNDGKWHPPARGISILLGPNNLEKVTSLELNDVSVTVKPPTPPAPPAGKSVNNTALDDSVDTWLFSNGPEFPGAKGTFTTDMDDSVSGKVFKLAGDFSGGGKYVGVTKDLKSLMGDTGDIRFKIKSSNENSIGLQLIDSSGQVHQIASFPIAADGQWHDVLINPLDTNGGEHWGGTNDGQWHGPCGSFSIHISSSGDAADKQPVIYLNSIQADLFQ